MVDVRRDESVNPPLRALFISYDGLLEPLGRSQIVPYLRALTRSGVRTRVISFEKRAQLADRATVSELRSRLAADGIEWNTLRYHKNPRVAATVVDLVVGTATAIRMAREQETHIVHARSYVAGLMGWAVKFLVGPRFVFDMRGFWPEERVELGLFRPDGLLYRASKRCERLLLAASDHIVVLTDSAKAILRDREAGARLVSRSEVSEKPIAVIPCCTDLERFQPAPRDEELAREHGLEDRLVIGNIGAVNKRYMLPEMFRFAFHVKSHRPAAKFVYLTSQDASLVRADARDAGLRDDDVLVLAVAPDEVPRWLTLFRCGVFFLRPSYASKASSYTKLAEFLACGVPVVTNKGVGDVDKMLGSSPCGILVPGLTDSDLATAARRVLPLLDGEALPRDVRDACRSTASRYFDVADGARRYLSLYTSLAFPERERARTPVAVELG